MGALGMSHYPAAVEQIQGGRAAMFPMGAWWQQQAANPNPPPLDQNLAGYAPFKFPDVTGMGGPEDLLGGIDVMLGVTRDSENPDAACRVITDFISGAGAQALINTYNDLPAYIGLRPESFGSENQEAVLGSLHRRLAADRAICPSAKEPGCQASVGRRAGWCGCWRDDTG